MRQVRHAVARALEVSLHAAAVSDSLQGAQAGARGQIRHAVPQLLWNHIHHTMNLTKRQHIVSALEQQSSPQSFQSF